MLTAILDHIPVQEVLRYLGCPDGQTDPSLSANVERCAAQIMHIARPKAVYRLFDWDGVQFSGIDFAPLGGDIQRHLNGCAQAVLMAATLGEDVERLLMRTQITDMAQAFILDGCASAAIENVCDHVEAQLRSSFKKEHRYLTDRYSPGYGDFPISQQQEFCAVLDTRRQIGLTVSQSGILLPRKSVTAILGISDTLRTYRSSGCAQCSFFEHCSLRKVGGCHKNSHT